MSGGTWDYEDRRLDDLAGQLRSGRARWSGEDTPDLDLARARAAMAEMLETVGDLLHDLDYHFAGDSEIPNESEWMFTSAALLRKAVEKFY